MKIVLRPWVLFQSDSVTLLNDRFLIFSRSLSHYFFIYTSIFISLSHFSLFFYLSVCSSLTSIIALGRDFFVASS